MCRDSSADDDALSVGTTVVADALSVGSIVGDAAGEVGDEAMTTAQGSKL